MKVLTDQRPLKFFFFRTFYLLNDMKYKQTNSSLQVKLQQPPMLQSAGRLPVLWAVPKLTCNPQPRICLVERAAGCYITISQLRRCWGGYTVKYQPRPAWMIATTAQQLSASPSIPSAIAVMHSHLGLPSWLVLTRLAERKEEQGQMVPLNWQGWRGWHRAGHPCESQTAGSHLDPAGAARILIPITSLET